MTETEIALQLTIKTLEHVGFSLESNSPRDVGLAVSEIYNTISQNIHPYDMEE